MNLHLDKDNFEGAIVATANYFEIPEIFIEKDYWVTYALFAIFNHEEIGKDTIFKGGTALSKCYNMIERFSEDIDLLDTFKGNVQLVGGNLKEINELN